MPPEVTVVIPTRDRWEVLGRAALASALRQEAVELEVVVVDDGSAEAAPAGTTDDPRVRTLRHDRPRGVASARNTGLHAARGEWVAFLDDDDLWSPAKVRAQLDAARGADAGFAYSGAVWVDEELRLDHGHAAPSPASLARALLRWNVVWGGGSNVVARRHLVRDLGGFDEELHQLADWDLWIRLAAAAPCAAVEEVHVALVRHPGSMLLVDREDVFLELDRLVAKHRSAAARAGVEVDRARFARWVGNGHLRAGRRREAARAYLRGNRAPGNLLRAAISPLGPTVLRRAGAMRARLGLRLTPGEHTGGRPQWLELYR